MKLPISAIIVGFNEAPLLRQCLPALSFCDEILYFDLGSTDESVKVAESHQARIIPHERVLSCEWIHSKFAHTTKHDWVLISDPDEVLDQELVEQITELFRTDAISARVGAIRAPWIFYINRKRLLGTPWGGVNKRVLLVHNKRFQFTEKIHVGRHLKDGYDYLDIELRGSNVIHHYWMRDYWQLLEKHLRYLKNEGEARYLSGRRTSLKSLLKEPFSAFSFGFLERQGYRDGFRGFLLSVFWSWYQTSAQIKLLRHQRAMLKVR